MADDQTDLGRNDIDGALRLAKKLMEEKKWVDEDAKMLILLQDEDKAEELEQKLIQLMEEMGIDTE